MSLICSLSLMIESTLPTQDNISFSIARSWPVTTVRLHCGTVCLIGLLFVALIISAFLCNLKPDLLSSTDWLLCCVLSVPTNSLATLACQTVLLAYLWVSRAVDRTCQPDTASARMNLDENAANCANHNLFTQHNRTDSSDCNNWQITHVIVRHREVYIHTEESMWDSSELSLCCCSPTGYHYQWQLCSRV